MSEPTTMFCVRLRCTLRIAICLRRQAERRPGPSGAPRFRDCEGCPQGAELAGVPVRRAVALPDLEADPLPRKRTRPRRPQGFFPRTERPQSPHAGSVDVAEFLARKRVA